MKIAAIIPARLASTRFPGKILFPLHGLPMLEHVRRRALLCPGLSEVVVATCDEAIADMVRGNGGRVIMTSDAHTNGTTRTAEAVAQIDCTHVILLQGDEPLLLPRHVETFAQAIAANPQGDAWNAVGPLEDESELDRHSFVKCAVGRAGQVLYCFRRGPGFAPFATQQKYIRKMLGIIAFRKDFLLQLTALPAGEVEVAESIEQMRILEFGHRLEAVLVEPSLPSVNEPAEADIVLDWLQRDAEQRALLEQIQG